MTKPNQIETNKTNYKIRIDFTKNHVFEIEDEYKVDSRTILTLVEFLTMMF